jgi:hypothetical protein
MYNTIQERYVNSKNTNTNKMSAITSRRSLSLKKKLSLNGRTSKADIVCNSRISIAYIVDDSGTGEQKFDGWKTQITDDRERELEKARQEHETKLAAWKAEREKELADAKKADDLMIEQWRHEREQKREEQKARREYENEARKRLYEKFEPLLFQFSESCDRARLHIFH